MGYTGFYFFNKYMENKEVKIQVPEGYEIDENNSTFECIKFKPKQNLLIYDDIAKELFFNKGTYFINPCGDISNFIADNEVSAEGKNNAVSKEQCKRLLAINQLINVAYYFNEIVDKDVNSNYHYYFLFDENKLTHTRIYKNAVIQGIVSFKTEESICKAIKILGEKTIKLAICL